MEETYFINRGYYFEDDSVKNVKQLVTKMLY